MDGRVGVVVVLNPLSRTNFRFTPYGREKDERELAEGRRISREGRAGKRRRGKGEGEEARKDDKVWSNEIMPVYLATDDDNRNFVVGGGARRGRL